MQHTGTLFLRFSAHGRTPDENSLIDALFARSGVHLPEKVSKTQVLERLVL